jgi:hypothetical protein
LVSALPAKSSIVKIVSLVTALAMMTGLVL